ncbi:MAG TPA: hypothetical protein VNF48_08185 [Gammaproteobacteria bacterium]|nr:hypothetical protein [Gammaproteobacteria bacterium]
MASESKNLDIQMHPEQLYQEEVFTDRSVGTIQRLTPVTRDGGPDQTRSVVYTGQTQILTPMGTLPISFEIEAKSLNEAAQKFGEGAKAAIEQTMKRLEELRREAASSIVLPSSGAGAPGAIPGSGKIRIP